MVLNFEIETEAELKEKKILNDKAVVFIMLNQSENFGEITNPYDIKICGKAMWKWVEFACSDFMIKTCYYREGDSILSLIKPHLTNSKYSIVLFSDTPLLKKTTINDALTFVESKQAKVVNLERGYIFETNYVRGKDEILNTSVEKFGTNDFMQVKNLEDVSIVCGILQNMILKFHISNGVLIYDTKSTFIESEVIIEPGTIIEPNNVLKGTTFIGKNVILEPGNIVIDSIICDDVILKNSYVFSSKISEKSVVGPFEKLINKKC